MLNILFISVTFEVLRLYICNSDKELQLPNIFSILLTLEVSNEVRFKEVKEIQS